MAQQIDETEDYRRARQAEVNAAALARTQAEEAHGQCWDTEELQRDFDVLGFMAPYVVVRRRSDGKKGSLEFQHRPRLYWGWTEDR